MNPTIPHPAMDKYGRLNFLALVRQPIKKKTELKPALLRLQMMRRILLIVDGQNKYFVK